jgi:transcriptional/translational regulatory protein YebC/TACO1
MAGHRKWAKVKRSNAVKDPRRSKLFSRLSQDDEAVTAAIQA